MANFIPNWVGVDGVMSAQNFMSAYTIGANPTLAQGSEVSGQPMQGADPSLGLGNFIYAQNTNATTINAGDVVEVTPATFTSGSSVSVILGVQQWAGTANSGKTLGVALVAMAQNQYAWIQFYGAALVNTNAAVAVNASAYWNSLGKIQSTAVASKQMVSAQCVVASSASFGQAVGGVVPTVSATQAVYFIGSPHAQSAIT